MASPRIQDDHSRATNGKKRLAPMRFFRFLKQRWDKSGLDRPTVLLMMKGGLPPTIAVAIYQAGPVASTFTTVGYLSAIISVLGFAIMPRAKFVQMIVLDVLAVCVAAAVTALMMFSAVSARQNTAHAVSSNGGSPTAHLPATPYNSSASAVSGVWLFFQLYMINAFRAKYPQFQFPVIMYSIFTCVASTYAPKLPNMTAGLGFVQRLLEAFLTGLGLATGVSLFIHPVSTRDIVFKEMASYIGGLRGALKAHAVHFETLEREDMFGRADTYDSSVEKIGKKGKIYSPEAEAIRTALHKLSELHGKLHGDLRFAKREIALGKLGPDDLQAISGHLRRVMIPVMGLGFVVDIFQRLSDVNKWNEPLDAAPTEATGREARRERAVHDWNDLMRSVHDPFASMIETIDEGLQHVSSTLELAKPNKKQQSRSTSRDGTLGQHNDAEGFPSATMPGERGFSEDFERRLQQFSAAKRIALRTWCEEQGIQLQDDIFERPSSVSPEVFEESLSRPNLERGRRQLFLFLYMEQLLHATGRVVLDFVHFADERAASGKLSRTRLIIPGWKRLRKWAISAFQVEDSNQGDSYGDIHTQNYMLQLGEAYQQKKNPEHLPPETKLQLLGDKIRYIPAFLRSPASAYGFRVACATMTIAIVAFLDNIQTFFVEQRLVWAMIMVNLSMSPTSGQSIFSFVLRILGTTVAMVASFLVWYIPDERTPGVIVFLFVFLSIGFYIPIKMFRFRVIGMISIVTTTMIIGYELQVRKVGEKVATSNGQPYYPVYLLAPYRLAAVTGGIAVAFTWTFFPYPISEHSALRQSLGASLYLLASYYSIIHETLAARMHGEDGSLAMKTSAGQRLEKARNKVLSKQMVMLNGLREYSSYLRWEVPIGGKFPKKKYDTIILYIENIANYLSLLGYVSDALMHLENQPSDENSNSAWIRDFNRLIARTRVTSHQVTSVLCLLSASITNRQPLPPYLKTPKPYSFSKQLEEVDKDILSVKHIAEPGFAAFAVLQICSRCIAGDIERLVGEVKGLVGEMDFSFHAISTADNSAVTFKVTQQDPRVGGSEDRDKND